MRFTIPQSALANLLARGGVNVQQKAPIAALETIRLVADSDAQTLALASSDMDRFAEAQIAANVEEGGALLVPGQVFATLIKKHPKSAEIAVESGDAFIVVKAGRSKVRIPSLPVDNFPVWADEEPVSSFDLAGEDFERALSRVRFAAADDESKWFLQGVCMDALPSEQVLHFVATDTHRLALSGVPIPEGAQNCPRITIPSETVDAALTVFKGTPSVHISVTKSAASFAADGLRLSGRLLDKEYPDYQRVIPARGQYPVATFKRSDFVDCLDRANVLTGEGTMAAIVFESADDGIRLSASNQKGGAAEEELSGTIAEDFVPFKFNPRYAAAFLSTLNVDLLAIEQSNPAGAHLIYSEDAPDFLGLLMPVTKG